MTDRDDSIEFGTDESADAGRIEQAWQTDLKSMLDAREDLEWGSSGDGIDLTMTPAQMLEFHDRVWEVAKDIASQRNTPSSRKYRFHWLIVPAPQIANESGNVRRIARKAERQ